MVNYYCNQHFQDWHHLCYYWPVSGSALLPTLVVPVSAASVLSPVVMNSVVLQ